VTTTWQTRERIEGGWEPLTKLPAALLSMHRSAEAAVNDALAIHAAQNGQAQLSTRVLRFIASGLFSWCLEHVDISMSVHTEYEGRKWQIPT